MDKDAIQKLALRARVAQRVMLGFSSRKKRDILTAIADGTRRDVLTNVIAGRDEGTLFIGSPA